MASSSSILKIARLSAGSAFWFKVEKGISWQITLRTDRGHGTRSRNRLRAAVPHPRVQRNYYRCSDVGDLSVAGIHYTIFINLCHDNQKVHRWQRTIKRELVVLEIVQIPDLDSVKDELSNMEQDDLYAKVR